MCWRNDAEHRGKVDVKVRLGNESVTGEWDIERGRVELPSRASRLCFYDSVAGEFHSQKPRNAKETEKRLSAAKFAHYRQARGCDFVTVYVEEAE